MEIPSCFSKPQVNFEVPRFETQLIYVRDAIYRACPYDPSNHLVPIIQNTPQPHEPYVMAIFQWGRYVNAKETLFLLTLAFESMSNQK